MKIIKYIQNGITVMLAGLIGILLIVFFIPQCLGYQAYNIRTESMTPKYPVGGMIYVKPVKFGDLKVGDVITYNSSGGNGWVVTHRVSQIDSVNGTIVTKGDANNTEDGSISFSSVIGKATDFCIPLLGGVVTKYQNGNGKLFTIMGIVVLMGISFLLDIIAKKVYA